MTSDMMITIAGEQEKDPMRWKRKKEGNSSSRVKLILLKGYTRENIQKLHTMKKLQRGNEAEVFITGFYSSSIFHIVFSINSTFRANRD